MRGSFITPVAQSIPFDNSTNGFVSNNVQDAIVESSHLLTDFEATATGGVTAGTGADALMTGMTLSPPAGVYIVWFSCDINCASVGAVTTVGLYVGGTQDAPSQRKVAPFDGGLTSSVSARCGVAINRTVTVTAGQAIEVRWSASGGTNTVAARCLTILRVGT